MGGCVKGCDCLVLSRLSRSKGDMLDMIPTRFFCAPANCGTRILLAAASSMMY
jgi:hypothetical protein